MPHEIVAATIPKQLNSPMNISALDIEMDYDDHRFNDQAHPLFDEIFAGLDEIQLFTSAENSANGDKSNGISISHQFPKMHGKDEPKKSPTRLKIRVRSTEDHANDSQTSTEPASVPFFCPSSHTPSTDLRSSAYPFSPKSSKGNSGSDSDIQDYDINSSLGWRSIAGLSPQHQYPELDNEIHKQARRKRSPGKKRGRPPKIGAGLDKYNSMNKEYALPTPVPQEEDTEFRARSSIPLDLSWPEFARQGMVAAWGARLNPFALHPSEFQILKSYITKPQVTIYLNIRNAICRLWHRNPLVAVTRFEAVGCAKSSRHFGLAQVAYDWLVRHGHINFGCLDIPSNAEPLMPKRKKTKQQNIVVIGAGVSGLSCARQLEGLIRQLGDKMSANGEKLPKVTVLEGRNRVGGRVYSHPFKTQIPGSLPSGLRNTADMGAMIITGFSNGNPLHYVLRGQLGTPYHKIKDATILYDCDGKAIDESHDARVQALWNDVLDRACAFKSKTPRLHTVLGDETMIRIGQDPKEHWRVEGELLDHENQTLDQGEAQDVADPHFSTTQHTMTGVQKALGRAYVISGSTTKAPAAQVVAGLGWRLREDVSATQNLELASIALAAAHPSLGDVIHAGFKQYGDMTLLQPKDRRLFHWHAANLEYGYAASLNDIGLFNWDQDGGNEFEGPHTEVVGGYSQLPRGLAQLPYPLNVKMDQTVDMIKQIHLNDGSKRLRIHCEDGNYIDADHVVLTVPIGVLKAGSIQFQPPLPAWKSDCIDRMEFGLLNKTVLVFDEPFWHGHWDGLGTLNAPSVDEQGSEDYTTSRGLFYYIWNISKTAGRPALTAISVGPPAERAEDLSDSILVSKLMQRLRLIFRDAVVPEPSETIISRWRQDRFARGSYSFVGQRTKQDDYDCMAKSVGNIHFAGEGTCGGYPATVHGAFLSGLRAASDVINSLVGPIEVPNPLVPRSVAAKIKVEDGAPPMKKSKPGYVDVWEPVFPVATAPDTMASTTDKEVEDYEARLTVTVFEKLGPRPSPPDKKDGYISNPFILFGNDKWSEVKQKMIEERITSTGNPSATVSRKEVRIALGKLWKEGSEEVKKPYIDMSDKSKVEKAEYGIKVKLWDAEAAALRKDFMEKYPPPERLRLRFGSESGAKLSKLR